MYFSWSYIVHTSFVCVNLFKSSHLVCFYVQKLVVKPDQLIKRRGKLGLIKVNADFPEVKSWVEERMGKDQQVGRATGKLRNFIIEPFVPHGQVRIVFSNALCVNCNCNFYSHSINPI
jgi:succinyl-CoA synthetase beta subunit